MIKIPHYYKDIKGAVFEVNSDGSSDLYKPSNRTNRRLALVDRDGVIIRKAPRHQYITKPEDIVLLEGTAEAIKYLNERKIPVVVHNNAPGIYKKLLTMKEYYEINSRLGKELKSYGAFLDAVVFCPHPAPTEGDTVNFEELCTCRKPKPGMLNLAVGLFHADKTQTIVFDDFESGIQAAKNADVIPAYIATRHDEYEETERRIRKLHKDVYSTNRFNSLLEAVRLFDAMNG